MEGLALIIFKLLYDGRARPLLQATAKPRAKAYRVKPGQNHGSPRLASGYGYLRRYYRNIRQFHLGERKPVDLCGKIQLMGNEDRSAKGKRNAEGRENVENSPIKSRVCPTYTYSFYFLSLSLSLCFFLPCYDELYLFMTSLLSNCASLFPFSFFSLVIQYAAAYDRNLNPSSIERIPRIVIPDL